MHLTCLHTQQRVALLPLRPNANAWLPAMGSRLESRTVSRACWQCGSNALQTWPRAPLSRTSNGVVPTRFSILSTRTSAPSCFHWVSVVYSIKKKKEDHGTQPGTEENHTPPASSQRRLNFTGSAASSSLLFRREDGQPDPHGLGGYAPRGRCPLPSHSCSGCRNCGH